MPSPSSYGAMTASQIRPVVSAGSIEPWEAAAWITTTLRDDQGNKCPCPPGCLGDCAVRSQWLFDGKVDDKRTIRPLDRLSQVPTATLNVSTASSWGTVAQFNTSAFRNMDGCPPFEHMECIACDSSLGYYPMAFSGQYSIEGIRQTGTGVSCYYLEVCAEGESCDVQTTAKDLGYLILAYAIVFFVLLGLYIFLRKVSWLRMAMDSAAWLEPGNPKFPPRDIQLPKPREDGLFCWLTDAWYRENNWLKEFTTPDEYMLVRWFKLSSRFFFFAGLFCCPILMLLYEADTVASADKSEKIVSSLDTAGIARYTLLNARSGTSFVAAIAMLWVISFSLMALMRVESRKYVSMMWSVNPNKTGIKANAIVVKDMPLLTTAPVPNRLAKLGAVNLVSGKVRNFNSVKKLDKIFDDEDVGCAGKLKLFITDGTLSGTTDSAKIRVLYKEESMALLINKFERVLGKDCIAFKMLAADTRRLDKAANKWANAREQVTMTMQAIDDLHDREKNGVLKNSESRQLSRALKEIDGLKRAESVAFDEFISTRDEYINNQSPACSAVIVFARQMDAVIASQIQVDSVPGQWVTEPAPGNSDVVWHNLSLTTVERAKKTTQAWMIGFFISLFFMYPVNVVTAAISKEKVTIVNSLGEPVYNVILSIVLTIFLVIGHVLSLVVSRQTGHIAVSSMDSFGASMYFWLLILNLVFGNLSSTPLWNDINDWIQKPHLFTYQFILRLMNTSSFFLQFILLRTATSPVLEIIHPPVLLGFVIKCLLYRSRARTWPALKKRLIWAQPTPTPSHRVPAQCMLVFFIGTVYAVVSPLLLPVCSVFFFFFYVFWKHNIVYHYIQQYSAGTSMWSWLVNKMFFSLIFSQIMLCFGLPTLGFDTIKYRVGILPLVFITAVEWVRINNILKSALKVPVYTAAHLKDKSATDEDSDEDFFGKNGESAPARAPTPDELDLQFGGERDVTLTMTSITEGGKQRKKLSRGIVPVDEMRWSEQKHSNILANTREQGKAEIEYKVKKGIWQTYAPSVLWPLAAEKSAGSIFLRRWKQIKARKIQEQQLLDSVAHLPADDPKKMEVIKTLALKKQARDKAADAVLRKSTSPYLQKIREKRAAEGKEEASWEKKVSESPAPPKKTQPKVGEKEKRATRTEPDRAREKPTRAPGGEDTGASAPGASEPSTRDA